MSYEKSAKILMVLLTLVVSWLCGVHFSESFTFWYVFVVVFTALISCCKPYNYDIAFYAIVNLIVHIVAVLTFGQGSWSVFVGG